MDSWSPSPGFKPNGEPVSSPGPHDDDADGFASADNLAQALPAINQQLKSLALPSPLELVAPSAADVARSCNVLFLLLQQRQRDVEFRESAAAEARRLKADLARAETQAAALREELSSATNALAAAARVERATALEHAQALAKVTGERDAALKEKAAAVAKAAQAVVEGRRRDKERERLEDRLRATLGENKPVRARPQSAISVSAPLSGPGAAASPAVASLQNEVLLELRNELRVARSEASDLRGTVSALHEAVQRLCPASAKRAPPAGAAGVASDDESDEELCQPSGEANTANDVAFAPLAVGRGRMERRVRRDLDKLGNWVRAVQAQASSAAAGATA